MEEQHFDRTPVYQAPVPDRPDIAEVKDQYGNNGYRTSKLTYLSLFVLIILYPAQGYIGGDPTEILKNLDNTLRMIVYLSTMLLQWTVFLLLILSTHREKTGLRGLGLKKIRVVDFFWGGALLLSLFLVSSGIAKLLEILNYPVSGEVGLLLPQTLPGKITWVFLAFTAGFCEETAFRGYVITRLRLTGKLRSWLIPVLVSSLAFGASHGYQGPPNMIMLSILGVMFGLVYIRTKSIWPCIIAHFFLDFIALFSPQ
ncbi:MAG TPA: CPBP family intramembrane glutamic endopeptidase [candidate division Zixibacteria bacterium]|nr:CPBP family intramembrane glutamic endopeptidase [candidate division Zixibacteria bacterium]